MTQSHDQLPVYTAAAPAVPDAASLRARIPGWGVDLDPADRPAVPQQSREPTGAHWVLPPDQPELSARERSIEHERLTPVFGTSVPLRGLSGRIRRYAYRQFSEAKAAHWLLLLAGDRVDAIESHLTAALAGHPDNPITESGLAAEFRDRAGTRSAGRADSKHLWLDPIVILGPWLAAAAVGVLATRAVVRRILR